MANAPAMWHAQLVWSSIPSKRGSIFRSNTPGGCQRVPPPPLSLCFPFGFLKTEKKNRRHHDLICRSGEEAREREKGRGGGRVSKSRESTSKVMTQEIVISRSEASRVKAFRPTLRAGLTREPTIEHRSLWREIVDGGCVRLD